jgi:hypothetical protein
MYACVCIRATRENLPFCSLHAVVDYVNEFYSLKLFHLGEKLSVHDTFSHFTRHKTIMLMIHTNTHSHRKGKN